MRETLREPERRQARLYQENSRSTAVRRRNRRYRGRRNNGGTVLILLLFCALLIGGGIGTWKMAISTASATPASATDDSAGKPSGPADPEPPKKDPAVQAVSSNQVENRHPEDGEPATDPEPATAPPEEPSEEHIEMEPLPDDLNEMAQDVIAEIITSDMTKMEQAKAVWDFTKNGIRYTGDSDKSNWESGAREGLTSRKGDCFTYYAVSRALLTALEIDNLEVQRVGGISSHYWNLVNCGDGWYHFDATPRSSKLPYFVSFMFTDQEAADYTVSVGGGREYYTFDGSLYPERATEKPWESGASELPAQ